MKFAKTLTRNEMRDITAGSCQWNDCGDTSSYYNCLGGKCSQWYPNPADRLDCQNTVNAQHASMVDQCDIWYG